MGTLWTVVGRLSLVVRQHVDGRRKTLLIVDFVIVE